MTITVDDYENNFPIAWCPGCGNFSILKALKQALVEMALKPRDFILVSGIGQAAKLPHYLMCHFFNGLHGRSLPIATAIRATAIRIANHEMPVIVIGGDGDTYGEGGNHFLHALRRNIDLTLITHNNQVFGLTQGQASPTTEKGFMTKAQIHGVIADPFNPLATALTLRAPFVARGFAGNPEQLTGLIKEAVNTPGFSLVDVLQPCVSYDRVHTFEWYKHRVYQLNSGSPRHNTEDLAEAIQRAGEWGEKIPTGVFYNNPDKPSYEKQLSILKEGPPLVKRSYEPSRIEKALDSFL
jgi:2-oxoglutarate ferredoxin oxidoreductase subunit beta